ncbi:MAG: pyridoxamine 5'-phosphate oxidase family protein [Lachnospiraceae bacterium]|nr:pyridoxamine 5'-phosphate oxidase family protein [Lachnospiraceae bacterium]
MKEVLEFLRKCGVFYIATAEGDQPRVRPFGAVHEFEGKIYLITSNQKPVFAQLAQNPKIEICGMEPGGKWIRIAAKAVRDDRIEARESMLEANPSLKGMYSADDGKMEVLYLADARAVISSFTEAPVMYAF